MKRYAYRIVNVFARGGRLTGNPLAVFEDARGLEDADMQAVARQMNLSETTFILPSEKATARVRIFTPSFEMSFAGHPTLGTAHVVRALSSTGDALKLEMKAGIIPVTARRDRWTLQANAPTFREVDEPRAELAEMLGLEESDIADRPLWVAAGREQLIVPVTREDAVLRAQPKPDVFFRLKSVDGNSMAYVVFDGGDARGLAKSRFFFPNGAAVLEDPATGSACANFGGWFTRMRAGADIERIVHQGDEIHRPSTLYLSVKGGAIFVGGDVIDLATGTLEL